MKKLSIIACLLSSVFLYNCATNPVTGKKQVVLMSESQEIAMGQEADPQIIAQFGLYEDTALQNFINRKGREMAAISHRPGIQYNFRIVDSEVLNAFAVPGGYVYFTRGIMGYFNNEAEFAGVLGHEIGHITARHSVEQQRNQLLGQLGIIAGVIIAPELGQFADAASQGLGLLFLKFGRDAERESDRLGVEYSSKIGYDAREMADFFTVLERQGQASGSAELPDFLSTHPNPGDRQQAVTAYATEVRQQLNLTNPQVNRNEYLRRIEGIVYGEDPRQGYREGGMFYHPVLRFQYPIPANWNYANSPQQVQIASPDGKALMILMMAPGNSLQEAANAAVQNLKLQVVNSRQTTVNGLPAIAVWGQQQQQNGGILRTLSYFIQHGNNIYHLVGVSMAADFPSYENVFMNIQNGFAPLTDQAKINKQPERIRLRTVNSATTLQQALRSFGVVDKRLEELALLNGMRLTDNVPAGTLIKVVAP